MADYDCYPLWISGSDGTDNVDPSSLPITPELARELMGWAMEYDATLNRADPAESGFPNPQDEDAFYEHGRDLASRLAAELPDEYEVEYFDGRGGSSHRISSPH